MPCFLRLLIVIGLLAIHVKADGCKSRETCGECMASVDCYWCLDEGLSKDERCASVFQEVRCNEKVDPQSEETIIEEVPISEEDGDDYIVQISPQRTKLKLRPGTRGSERVDFTIAQSQRYPLDLYLLLDLSWSMNETRSILANKADEVINGIKKITEDLRIGFGSFIDKNLPPFTSSTWSLNCAKENPNCSPPYSFYHRTPLRSIEAEELRNEIINSPLGGNIDEPEGSLDGLMQTMVCTERVGWRNNTRKIILLSTDRDFHYAMDGKLVGILDRNDGICHLNGTNGNPGFYTHSDRLDYPSVSQISAVVQHNSFLVIFAVIPRYVDIWTSLSRLIPGSVVEALDNDAQNLVNIIQKQYESITSSVEVKLDNVPPDVVVTIKTNCNGQGAEEIRKSCSNVELGSSVHFVAEVSARKCLKSPITFTISPVGLDQSLQVEVDTICDCDCETPGNDGYYLNSPACSKRGDLTCSLCKCHQGFFGDNCQCEARLSGNSNDPQKCVDPNNPDTHCNGYGKCECGRCSCFDPRRHGNYCQCEDDSCPRDSDNVLCHGNGDCGSCGKCQCFEGWSGDLCDCNESQDQCMSPYNGEVCSGHGRCECNKCICNLNDKNDAYTGDFCEKFPFEFQSCQILEDCVECFAFGTGPEAETDCSGCVFQYAEVNPDNMTLDLKNTKFCTGDNEKRCEFVFTPDLIASDELIVYLHILDGYKEKCPKAQTAAITIGLAVAVFLLGLFFLLAIKCVMIINDRRMVARFEKETEKVRFASNQNANDIYKSPVTQYQNPMHGKAF